MLKLSVIRMAHYPKITVDVERSKIIGISIALQVPNLVAATRSALEFVLFSVFLQQYLF